MLSFTIQKWVWPLGFFGPAGELSQLCYAQDETILNELLTGWRTDFRQPSMRS